MAENYNYNNLLNNGYTISIARLPQTMFRVTNVIIPSISLPPAETPYASSMLYLPGSAMQFDALTVEFIVDENLQNYREIFNWITQQRYAAHYKPANEREEFLVSDGTVFTLNNSSSTNLKFNFRDLFPVSLGPLNFDSTISQTEPVSVQVEFRFTYFTIE